MLDQTTIDAKVDYRLSDVAILEVVLSNMTEAWPQGTAYNFNLEVVHSVSPTEKIVRVVVKVTLVGGESGSVEFAKLGVGFRYEFQSSESMRLIDGKVLPKRIANHLNDIALSTTRGIYFSEVRGTTLQDKLIPLVDPDILEVANM